MSGYTDQGVGYQDTDTSLAAASDMSEKADTIRKQVLDCLHMRSLTADEIAKMIGKHYGSVRPRLTELKNEKFVQDSGVRRKGIFNKMHIVWELSAKQRGA